MHHLCTSFLDVHISIGVRKMHAKALIDNDDITGVVLIHSLILWSFEWLDDVLMISNLHGHPLCLGGCIGRWDAS